MSPTLGRVPWGSSSHLRPGARAAGDHPIAIDRAVFERKVDAERETDAAARQREAADRGEHVRAGALAGVSLVVAGAALATIARLSFQGARCRVILEA